MNRLANTVGTRINIFDSNKYQNVETFNRLFPECPIRKKDLDIEVSIGAVADNNCRMITVGSEVVKHKMYSDMLYTVDKDEYFLDERDLELDEINGVPV
jgi:hypothetical protein